MKKILAVILLALMLIPAAFGQGSETRTFVRGLYAEDKVFCSAVVVAPGLALTADHCAGAAPAALRAGGPIATIVSRGDERVDIALLAFPSAEAACPCVRVAVREADVDETVYVVGYPFGIAQVLTVGASQGVHERNLPYGRRLVATALVGPGNSGGGVFVLRDGEFQLVGILVELNGHLSFAVPLADIRPLLERHAPKSV